MKKLLTLILTLALCISLVSPALAGTAISFLPEDIIDTSWSGSYTGGVSYDDGSPSDIIQRQTTITIEWCKPDETFRGSYGGGFSGKGTFGGKLRTDTPVLYEFEGEIDFSTGEYHFRGTKVLENSSALNVFFTDFYGVMTLNYMSGTSNNQIGTFAYYFQRDDVYQDSYTRISEDVYEWKGHTYQIFRDPVTPVEAEMNCAALGGHLVTVSSEEENGFLLRLFQNSGLYEFILGGTDRDAEGSWTWMTGEPMSFTFWDFPTEPNDGSGQGEDYLYAASRTGWRWIDFFGGYDSRFPYVCEWEEAAEQGGGRNVNVSLMYRAKEHVSYELPARFSEDWFSESAYTYNHELAWLTLCLELSSYSAAYERIWGSSGAGAAALRSANIADAYRQMGFHDAKYYNYDVPLNSTADKTAYSIAERKLADGSTLVAAIVRGGNYGGEWASNFHLTQTAMRDGYHEGFLTAARQVFGSLTEAIDRIGGPVKVWIAGYSRGAATANLTAGLLDDYAQGSTALAPEHIYAYTFATPAGVLASRNPGAALYQNIFNIVNPGDIVTRVAPSAWGYTRYGVTLTFDAQAGYSLTSRVDAAHQNLVLQSSDPAAAFDGSFSAGKNARNGAALDALLSVLMDLYPSEDEARHFLSVVSDVLWLSNLRVEKNGVWTALTSDEMLDEMRQKYSAADVEAAYRRVISAADSRELDFIVWVLEHTFQEELALNAADLAAVLAAAAAYHGVSIDSILALLARFADVSADKLIQALTRDDGGESWQERFSRTLKLQVTEPVNEVREKLATAIGRLAQIPTGHEPLTYLSWMQFSPAEIFHSGYGSGGGNSGGGGRDSAPSGWAVREVEAALSAALVPSALQQDYQAPVTREAVSDMFVTLLEKVTGGDVYTLMEALGVQVDPDAFSDTDNASVLVMNALGIINGVGGGRFDPSGTLTRAQIAAIINRVARLLGVETGGFSHSFTDVEGNWVSAELGWPSSAGIIQGVGNGRFDPNGKLTTEQAVLITYRALEALTA